MDNELKKIEGTVLGIGLSEKEQEILQNNKKVVECYLMDSNSKGNYKGKGITKTINIRKIRKKFRKKSFDYIIANFEEIRPHLRSFIKNSVYLNRAKIYYYNIKDFELDELENRYVRYGSEVEIKKNLVIINNANSKTNLFKNIFYYVCDLIYDVIDLIGRMLVN